MEARRFARHALMHPGRAAHAFPSLTLDAIQAEIAAQERTHRGEICFVVEAELNTWQLWHGVTARDRAREVFALRGVWNTEENNGVLVYVLLAERAVEIVADRGISARVPDEDWRSICREMETAFAQGHYEQGAVAGVRGVARLLGQEFPGHGEKKNELPDRPTLI
ncbi:MAG TPA: TPM domain-containing protein [Usitatibacter sp.]|nr:TPM domain-containing protein [Usitatibacter sp.]